MAVMGPSGSGKTTLLSVLSQQFTLLPRGARVTGTVALEGAFESGAGGGPPPRTRVAFLQQDDALLPTLTVAETVLMSLVLREEGAMANVSSSSIRVAQLLTELGLQGAILVVHHILLTQM